MTPRRWFPALVLAAIPLPAAAQYIAPPQMPLPTAWQGKTQAVVRVLNRLDSSRQTLSLTIGQTGSVGALQVTPRSCLVRPDGMARDAAALLEVRDAKGTTTDFSGWMFAAEPSLDVYQSPVYGVQLVGCAGADTAPAPPPLPPPEPAPSWMQPPVQAPAAPTDQPDTSAPPPVADQPQPDAVYPDGTPMPNSSAPSTPAPGSPPGQPPG